MLGENLAISRMARVAASVVFFMSLMADTAIGISTEVNVDESNKYIKLLHVNAHF